MRTCKYCGAKLELYETFIDYQDEGTIIQTEHYECVECHKLRPQERIATYELLREVWSEDDDC